MKPTRASWLSDSYLWAGRNSTLARWAKQEEKKGCSTAPKRLLLVFIVTDFSATDDVLHGGCRVGIPLLNIAVLKWLFA